MLLHAKAIRSQPNHIAHTPDQVEHLFTMLAQEEMVMPSAGALVMRRRAGNLHNTDLSRSNKPAQRPIHRGQPNRWYLAPGAAEDFPSGEGLFSAAEDV